VFGIIFVANNSSTEMTISYKWLSEYLPEVVEPEKLSKILTAVGLEVESLEKHESIKGGLQGLLIGYVIDCEKHPNSDRLKVTHVDVAQEVPLQIVCGANNVTAGQKVIVATVGTTIHPMVGEPITMRVAKIRGIESQGMICSEDEVGLGTSHDGIVVLPENAEVGAPASSLFELYEDWIYEIGLTPNRMDAMSHFGVARDVCAYLSFHNKADLKPKSPFSNNFKVDNTSLPIKVTVENKDACQRYAGVTISGVTIKESPLWLKSKLIAIGQRPINNIVDITNYILHETGQPLHAFDADAIKGGHVVVKNLAQDSPFTSLDDKERKLSNEDLMICNEEEGMCIAGVFGGLKSGVKEPTTKIFVESAWFSPTSIRRTSFRHGLRTEAATRFEKGVDISNVVNVLKRAALLIKEVAGGSISSEIVDVYPTTREKTQVSIKYHYLKKLSGKNYHPDAIRKILTSLGFEVLREGMDELTVAVPFSKPDISLPADIVEEILRIDGLDNIQLTGSITINPSIDENGSKESLREKISGYLVGLGFNEILTNSITNSRYFTEDQLSTTVKMINNLSADLDVMRPSMIETGLETISYNINRRHSNLQFFEFGKTYHSYQVGTYIEDEHLALYLTGSIDGSWKSKGAEADFYRAKGVASSILQLCGAGSLIFDAVENNCFSLVTHAVSDGKTMGLIGEISKDKLLTFDIKQPVYYIELNWLQLNELVSNKKITYAEVPKFPAVQRDLALVVDKKLTYNTLEKSVQQIKLPKLQKMQLFDVFESEKLGADKKSVAISLTFIDEEKTLTDKETDAMVNKIIHTFEKELSAEIRK
jgi:phenylalanyl-tRNA synthetase beta chain